MSEDLTLGSYIYHLLSDTTFSPIRLSLQSVASMPNFLADFYICGFMRGQNVGTPCLELTKAEQAEVRSQEKALARKARLTKARGKKKARPRNSTPGQA
jgi:hypothetical protein